MLTRVLWHARGRPTRIFVVPRRGVRDSPTLNIARNNGTTASLLVRLSRDVHISGVSLKVYDYVYLLFSVFALTWLLSSY